jgi:hypothetical protein
MNYLESAGPATAADGDNQSATARAAPAWSRELAQRLSGTVEVLLLWQPEIDRVELAIRDLATGVSFHLEVAPEDAIDAFNHPYAYASRRTPVRLHGRAPLRRPLPARANE